MALRLKNRGIERVRPLQGGLKGWRVRGYPLQQRSEAEASPPLTTPAVTRECARAEARASGEETPSAAIEPE